MGYFKVAGGVATPFLQKVTEYWYKVDGKKSTKEEYIAARKKGIADPNSPNFTDGSGLQTNDSSLNLAKKSADKRTSKGATVLTEGQTKALKP